MDTELLKYILPATIGVIGVLIGTLISFWTNYLIKSKETALRIHEKIFDKKVIAYENLLNLSQAMRITNTTQIIDKTTVVKKYPNSLKNRESLISFAKKYNKSANENSFWVDIEIVRLLHFFKDYLTHLSITLKDIPEEQFMNAGIIIKNDFLRYAHELETKVTVFFEMEIEKPKLKTRRGYFKYDDETYKKLLMDTELKKNEANIINLR